MNCYLFTPGRSWELALAEIKAVSPSSSFWIIKVTSRYILIESETEIDIQKYINLLGGTVKIGEILVIDDKKKNLEEEIIKQLTIPESPRITFGVTFLDDNRTNGNFLSSIKKTLKEKGIISRFILAKSPDGLSSVVIKKQHVIELQICSFEGKIVIAKTLKVQPFEDWGKRDYGRPCTDPKTGMLPPKVARMMVNLAYPIFQRQKTCLPAGKANDQKPVLLDPFCGVGTIPAEALLLGWDIIASDLSQEMIDKTRRNIAWLKTQYSIEGKEQYFISDATHISQKISKESIDTIVTEPFLGQNFERMPPLGLVERVITGLEKLYRGGLKDWHKILKPKGIVIIAFPSFNLREQTLVCKKTIDNCENLGYTLLSGPFPYSRPQAIVARNIYILKKK